MMRLKLNYVPWLVVDLEIPIQQKTWLENFPAFLCGMWTFLFLCRYTTNSSNVYEAPSCGLFTFSYDVVVKLDDMDK